MSRFQKASVSSIWSNIKRAFTSPKPELKGQDRFGNLYYEVSENKLHHSLTSKRYFVPGKGQNWHSPLPPEWESWLRYRRKEIPFEQEIAYNEQMAELKKKNAARLQEARGQKDMDNGSESSTAVGTTIDNKSLQELTSFPRRPGLEMTAGGDFITKK